MNKYDNLEILSRASFEVSKVRTFEYDDDRGEYYQDHDIESYAAQQELRSLICECFHILRRKDEANRQLQDAISARKQAESKYEELENKIKKFKEIA